MSSDFEENLDKSLFKSPEEYTRVFIPKTSNLNNL